MDKNMKITVLTDTSMIAWIIASATLVVGPIEIVLAEDFEIDQYLGCFYDGELQRQCQLRNSSFSSSSLTIDICIQHCRSSHSNTSEGVGLWLYASLQNGRDCRCSNDAGTQLQDAICNRACGGNVSQYCGGTYGNQNPTYVLYSVCPVGTYGLKCNEVCHCKSQVPCDRQTGRCPDGCHGKYTGAQCNQLTSFSEQYIGCYRDNNHDRAMEKRYDPGHRNTLQYCLDLCSSKYSYAGPQFAGECHCGESYDKHGRIKEGFCNYTCSGHSNQICGGPYALSVYGTCPTGNYGPKCAKVCNCEGRCHYKNGTCLKTECKSGWTGEICNIRECRNSNGGCASYEACRVVKPISSLTMSVCRCKTGYWRSGIRGECTDIDECSEIPNICGSFAKSCNNTEGGYTCHCTNGNVVLNSACIPDHECSNDLAFIVGAISGSINLLLSAMLIVIVILYWRMRKRSQNDSSVASTARSGKKSEEKLTKMNINRDNATNPAIDESTYVGLGNRTADDNRVYDALQMDDYANP